MVRRIHNSIIEMPVLRSISDILLTPPYYGTTERIQEGVRNTLIVSESDIHTMPEDIKNLVSSMSNYTGNWGTTGKGMYYSQPMPEDIKDTLRRSRVNDVTSKLKKSLC